MIKRIGNYWTNHGKFQVKKIPGLRKNYPILVQVSSCSSYHRYAITEGQLFRILTSIIVHHYLEISFEDVWVSNIGYNSIAGRTKPVHR